MTEPITDPEDARIFNAAWNDDEPDDKLARMSDEEAIEAANTYRRTHGL